MYHSMIALCAHECQGATKLLERGHLFVSGTMLRVVKEGERLDHVH